MRLFGLAFALAVSLTLVPLAAEGQESGKVPRIGWLSANMAVNPHMREAFIRGLRDLGYVEGRDVVIEYRDAKGKFERLPALAAELVALKVDVIVAGATLQALAAKQATTTIPIVFIAAGDPVSSGLVTSLAWPGGNVTRLSLLFRSWSASVWNCSSRSFRGSLGSLSSDSQARSASARNRTS